MTALFIPGLMKRRRFLLSLGSPRIIFEGSSQTTRNPKKTVFVTSTATIALAKALMWLIFFFF